MINKIATEYNENGCLLYSVTFPGAFTRGKTESEAIAKFDGEIESYRAWSGLGNVSPIRHEIVQRYKCDLHVEDADSDIIFDEEKLPLCPERYLYLKELVLKSASDFQALYDSAPDKDKTCLEPRRSFYGPVPVTPRDMYRHTLGVNMYYFNQIGAKPESNDDLLSGRIHGFEMLEAIPAYLDRPYAEGSCGELWSLAKVMRRFIWHDRIHAKAMYRMAEKLWPGKIPDPFRFSLLKMH